MEAAVARIEALTQTVDEKDRHLTELEDALNDASKRQAVSNAQLEKDGLKIRGLTSALEKTRDGTRPAGGSTSRVCKTRARS